MPRTVNTSLFLVLLIAAQPALAESQPLLDSNHVNSQHYDVPSTNRQERTDYEAHKDQLELDLRRQLEQDVTAKTGERVRPSPLTS